MYRKWAESLHQNKTDAVIEHLAKLSKRQRNFEKFQKDKAAQEIIGCTFKPSVSKKSLNLMRRQSKSIIENYDQKVSEFKPTARDA